MWISLGVLFVLFLNFTVSRPLQCVTVQIAWRGDWSQQYFSCSNGNTFYSLCVTMHFITCMSFCITFPTILFTTTGSRRITIHGIQIFWSIDTVYYENCTLHWFLLLILGRSISQCWTPDLCVLSSEKMLFSKP